MNSINKNIKSQKVNFISKDNKLVGEIYFPHEFEEQKTYPSVIVTGSWTTVKEQMPKNYAIELSNKGYLAFTFDFRYYGESEGEPRYFEDPESKIVDIKNAIDFLYNQKNVDKQKFYALGVCASSGYISLASINEKRLKAISLVAPWLHNQKIVEMIYGGKDGVQNKINSAEEAIEQFNKTGKTIFVPAVSTTDENAAMFGQFDYYLDKNRGAIPEWENKFSVQSWKGWLTFDPIHYADQIKTPIAIIHSENGAVPMGTKEFFEKLTCEKVIHWLSGNQFDFYDQPGRIKESLEKVDTFFKTIK